MMQQSILRVITYFNGVSKADTISTLNALVQEMRYTTHLPKKPRN